ncbi:MAG: hypothetical protein IJO31_07715 [Oscillospiraceae bacterium]|nr:hypothetical protein [Oscillospiraceae bacterium]
MSQRYSSVASIMAMLDSGRYSQSDITQALADLEAMKKSISSYQYESIKSLLEAKL